MNLKEKIRSFKERTLYVISCFRLTRKNLFLFLAAFKFICRISKKAMQKWTFLKAIMFIFLLVLFTPRMQIAFFTMVCFFMKLENAKYVIIASTLLINKFVYGKFLKSIYSIEPFKLNKGASDYFLMKDYIRSTKGRKSVNLNIIKKK